MLDLYETPGVHQGSPYNTEEVPDDEPDQNQDEPEAPNQEEPWSIEIIDTHVHITPKYLLYHYTAQFSVHSNCQLIPIGFSNLAIKALLSSYYHIPLEVSALDLVLK